MVPARAGETHFDVLGVGRTFALDVSDLEQRYKTISRVLHPDRFARAEPAQRMLSLQRATDLNQAYKTLRDPVRCAEYLLTLAGRDVGESSKDKVDPGFLMEIMELREGLLEARGQPEVVAKMAGEVRGRADAALREIEAGFAAGDLERVARAVVALRYFRRFLDEVEAAEEAA